MGSYILAFFGPEKIAIIIFLFNYNFLMQPLSLGAPAGLDEAWVKDVFVPTVQKVSLVLF